MSLPPRLQRELDDLRVSYALEVIEDPSFVNLVFAAFALGDGYNISHSELLLRIPRSYPEAGPDMFWVAPALTRISGDLPINAEHIETHLDRPWRRFSWHRKGPWNPNIDNLASYLEFIHRRLREKR